MECRLEVRIDSHLVPKVDKFRYLGSVVQADGELDGDVGHRVGVAWAKWRLASGMLCDPKISPKMKGEFYRSLVKPAMLYGAECWAVKMTHVRRLHAAEMRMLRWMCGKTRLDRISNEVIRRQVGMAPVEDKLWEARLRWFGHVRRRNADAPVRRCERITVIGGSRGGVDLGRIGMRTFIPLYLVFYLCSIVPYHIFCAGAAKVRRNWGRNIPAAVSGSEGEWRRRRNGGVAAIGEEEMESEEEAGVGESKE
ncbi:unnamed protein product [Cuscuta campestris]|uniref:Reverse transcriptase domain-containing protein n=1 Tax=Cuscuta campestris TaxID=132261 RepID=A0A484L4V7_9ASTE|nr:unnamed protein product [Cuscuta campestris]